MAKQQALAGVPARAVIPEITKAAEEYEEARDAWMKKSGPVRAAKEKLIDAMKKHSVQRYDEDDLHVDLKPGKESVKVRRGDVDAEE